MLSLTDISVRIAGRLLIDHSSVQIVPGARVGFVGRNGVGKSTLFHAIRGELPTETGSIGIPPRWRIGSLAQEAPDGPESLINVVLEADLERDALRNECYMAKFSPRLAPMHQPVILPSRGEKKQRKQIKKQNGHDSPVEFDDSLPCGDWIKNEEQRLYHSFKVL